MEIPKPYFQETFPTLYVDVLSRINNLKTLKYGATRNYIDGEVSYLSPYISRGFISTKFVMAAILKKGYKYYQIQKFIQELAWRDYWQTVWVAKKNEIDTDLKHKQHPVNHHQTPQAIVNSNTSITAIDTAIDAFYKTGYLHNHMRMYIASVCCNVGNSHWENPAKWMYYYLLDADWASNALSWQWVAGSNSNKKYYANQNNINHFCYTNQQNTFLDVGYAMFKDVDIPKELVKTSYFNLTTPLPKSDVLRIDISLPTYIYNFYNLDPMWDATVQANRILLLEPSHFKKHPISQKSIDFMLALSKNIFNIQIFVGEFDEINLQLKKSTIYYKEHPTTNHYKGIQIARDWMFNVQGYHTSFFNYWKKCKKQLPI